MIDWKLAGTATEQPLSGILPVQGAITELSDDTPMLDERYSLTSVEENTLVKYTFIYHFFGFLWTSEFVSAIGMITIAGAVASDYWVTDTRYVPQWPVLASFGRTMRYHTGSAAYGSLIVALIRLARYIMMCPPFSAVYFQPLLRRPSRRQPRGGRSPQVR